ncbi:MAG TPA: Holliday junction resolvase RuvX [Candidatus Saccharimonadia bacterium]|nr:Holliday junction resolvase RuvX [Candidatus Saccharimonadia bacterium]
MKKYLGIDYGARRIGLATANDEVKIASPLATVDAEELVRIIKRDGPFDEIIVGLPRSLSGQETPQTLAVRHFTDDVLFRRLNIDPIYQDEAGTSGMAEDRLKESGKPYEKKDIDAEAATIILQDYLDTI